MKVLFLDIDGVLITANNIKKTYKLTGKPQGRTLDPDTVVQLNRIMEQSNPLLVLSSTWRIFTSLEDMAKLINEAGGNNIKFHSATPRLNTQRGKEIQTWLNNLTDEELKQCKFVIVDDDKDMLHLIGHLIKTDFDTGLTEDIANRIIKILNS